MELQQEFGQEDLWLTFPLFLFSSLTLTFLLSLFGGCLCLRVIG